MTKSALIDELLEQIHEDSKGYLRKKLLNLPELDFIKTVKSDLGATLEPIRKNTYIVKF